MTQRPSFVGPHEGQELSLMESGTKPMSMFVEEIDCEFELFDEKRFDEAVQQGRLSKSVFNESVDGREARRIFYALPGEEWRIKAFQSIQDQYRSLCPDGGWRLDLERLIGKLLGYETADIEAFLSWVSSERDRPPTEEPRLPVAFAPKHR